MERWKRGTGRGGRRTCGEKLLAESGPATSLAHQTGETDALPLPEIADKGQGRGGRGHSRGTGSATADEAGLAQGRGGGVTDQGNVHLKEAALGNVHLKEVDLAPGTVQPEGAALIPGNVHLKKVDLAPGTVQPEGAALVPGNVHLKEVDLAPGTVQPEGAALVPGNVHLKEVDLAPGTVQPEGAALVPGTVHLKEAAPRTVQLKEVDLTPRTVQPEEVDLAPGTVHLERAPGTACESLSRRSGDGADLGHEKSGGVDHPHRIGTGSNVTTTYTMHMYSTDHNTTCTTAASLIVTILLLPHTSFIFYNCVLSLFSLNKLTNI